MPQMNRLLTRSPAKINLFLRVLGRRPDGYHDIVTVMARISLFDTVRLAFGQPSISVACTHPSVPRDETNLAYRAAQLFFGALHARDGVAISIEKAIPVGAGLGGGSSNAASVLAALNERYGFPFSVSGLIEIGLKIGADVPFFLFGRSAVARGIGEQLEAFEGMPQRSVVLVCPEFQVSTAWAYANLNLRLTNHQKNCNCSSFQGLLTAGTLLSNDLEQVTIGEFPEIGVMKEVLLDLGAEIALMSGSGPTVFGLFKDEQEAEKATHSIADQFGWKTIRAGLLLP